MCARRRTHTTYARNSVAHQRPSITAHDSSGFLDSRAHEGSRCLLARTRYGQAYLTLPFLSLSLTGWTEASGRQRVCVDLFLVARESRPRGLQRLRAPSLSLSLSLSPSPSSRIGSSRRRGLEVQHVGCRRAESFFSPVHFLPSHALTFSSSLLSLRAWTSRIRTRRGDVCPGHLTRTNCRSLALATRATSPKVAVPCLLRGDNPSCRCL